MVKTFMNGNLLNQIILGIGIGHFILTKTATYLKMKNIFLVLKIEWIDEWVRNFYLQLN